MIKEMRTLSGIILALALLAVAGWLLYAPALHSPFVFDDVTNIVDNPFIRLTVITSKDIAAVRHSPQHMRFMANLTLAINYYFHRYEVTSYHVVNVAIHVVTSLLLFLLARQTFSLYGIKSAWPPFLAAALWLVNPVHTQSVTYIVQRMNALSAMFVLLSLTCYIRARRTRMAGKTGLKPVILLAGAGLAGLFGLLSKETAAILPVIILLYEWFFFQDLDRAWLKKQLGWISVTLVVLMIIGLIYLSGSPVENLKAQYAEQNFTPGQRLLTEPQVVLYYLTLLFFPHPARLNLNYDFPPAISPINPATTLPAILALLALAAAAIYAARKHRLLSFAIIWFLATLAIESSFIGLDLIFEHRTYLPSVFPAIAAAYLLTRRIKPLPAGVLAVIAAIIICGFWTCQRNHVWADTLAFWQDNVRKSPDKAIPCNNLGLIYKNVGDLDKAMFFLKKGLALRMAQHGENHPETAESLSNIGLVYYQQGDYVRALEYLLSALKIQKTLFGEQDHTLYETYSNIGIVYDGQGDFEQAVGYYQRALAIEQAVSGTENLNTASIYNNLGGVWHNRGDYDQAIANYAKALKIRTKFLGNQHQQIAECYNNLGLAYGSRGDHLDAIRYYQQALNIELAVLGVNHPYTAATYFNLGLTSYARGDYHNAVFYMRKVLTLYRNTMGSHHSCIQTAESILNQALMKNTDSPSGTEGFMESRGQGVE